LNLLARNAAIDFVDADRQQIFDGPGIGIDARIAESYEGDTYSVSLAVNEKFDVDVYLLPAFDIRLNDRPRLFGPVLETGPVHGSHET